MGSALGIPPGVFYGLGWGLFIGHPNGMALWVMHWDSTDLHWGSSLGIPWKCSMAMPLGCPHGSPMELHWQLLHRSSLEDALWVIHWELPMWLLWDWMWLDPWEFHGMVLWVRHWDSMDLHWGCSLGIPWKCFMGRPLGCPDGPPPMELHWQCSIGAP